MNMPIPAVTSQDAFLRALLDEQVKQGRETKIAVEDVLRGLAIDIHNESPGKSVPSAVSEDIEHLEHLCLLEFFPSNPHVRLTPMGVYTALLFNRIERGGQPSATAAPLQSS
jgi:hypothetical protein